MIILEFFRKLRRYAEHIRARNRPIVPQLELALPLMQGEVPLPVVPAGYQLRTFAPDDAELLLALLRKAGFTFFDAAMLADALRICLPAGCFVVEHEASGILVATAMARHLASPSHLFGGRIDWVATDPEHRNRGLAALCAGSAARRLRNAGYDDIYVTTDDHRLGALKIFLDLGFRPVVHPALGLRWLRVYEALRRDPAEMSLNPAAP